MAVKTAGSSVAGVLASYQAHPLVRGKLKVRGGGPRSAQKFSAEVERVLREIRSTVNSTLSALSLRLESAVQGSYLGAGSPDAVSVRGISASTRLKRELGKRAGKAPAVPRFSGVKPLNRTGRLALAVQQSGRSFDINNAAVFARYAVDLKPGPITPGLTGGVGRPLSANHLARIHEFGAVFTVPLTKRSRAYLRALYDGTAGPPTAKSPGSIDPDHETGQAVILIPPRPVWRPVWTRFEQRQPVEFVNAFARRFPRQLIVTGTTLSSPRKVAL